MRVSCLSGIPGAFTRAAFGTITAIATCAFASATTFAQPAVAPKPNPQPKAIHVVDLRFAGLPAPLVTLSGHASYRIANIDCIPVDHARALGGVRLLSEHAVKIDWRKHSDIEFSGTVREAPLLDEDYFGLGVCRWELQTVDIIFTSPSTRFIGIIGRDALLKGQATTQHYLVSDFHARPSPIDGVFGEAAGFYSEKMGSQFTLRIMPGKVD